MILASRLLLIRIIRSLHRYLALFLTPWMLVYAISGITLNHREFFNKRYHAGSIKYTAESEQVYSGVFAEGAGPRLMAEQILSDLGLDGTYNVQENRNTGVLTIHRADPLHPRRIRYNPADQKLVVERAESGKIDFIRMMHKRRGYQHDYLAEDMWAFMVDLSIFAIIFWGLSGVWMWWRMRTTRIQGALFLGAGIVLFLVFFFTI